MAGHEVAVAGTVRARYMVAVDWFMLSFEIQAFYFYSRGVKWRKQIWWLVMSSLLEKMRFTSCCFLDAWTRDLWLLLSSSIFLLRATQCSGTAAVSMKNPDAFKSLIRATLRQLIGLSVSGLS